MKGKLYLPSILAVAAVALGVFALLSPNRSDSGIWIWGSMATLFGIYVLCGVVVSSVRRR